MKLFKEIKGVFKQPTKRFYLGETVFLCPYFYPRNVNPSIVSFRKLKPRDEDEYQEKASKSPWLKESYRFTNMPMVRRNKEWVFELFGGWYWLSIGYPIYIYWHGLGYKDKYDSPRFEWVPAFYVFFFKWQFCIHWNAPDGDNDTYYEMILWWKHYCKNDIKAAEESWGWVDGQTHKSTWNPDYLL
jgi:hypothetical protein